MPSRPHIGDTPPNFLLLLLVWLPGFLLISAEPRTIMLEWAKFEPALISIPAEASTTLWTLHLGFLLSTWISPLGHTIMPEWAKSELALVPIPTEGSQTLWLLCHPPAPFTTVWSLFLGLLAALFFSCHFASGFYTMGKRAMQVFESTPFSMPA